ncbi:MAG: early set domain-containing protein [Anaerolineae bacterium]
MIVKQYSGGEYQVVKVTFVLPQSIWADHIDLALADGDHIIFEAFKQDNAGDWRLTLRLRQDKLYRFNYLRDNQQWVGDKDADGFEFNPLDGTSVCLLDTHVNASDGRMPETMQERPAVPNVA